MEAEDAEPLPPLQTLEPDHNEALSPQRTATTKPPPPPEPQESPVASSGEQRLATEAQASATANEFPSENVGKARDAKRRSAKDASAAKTSSSAKKSPAAKAVATDCEEDIGHTEAELSALSLHHKDGLFYDILDYEQELILHDRTARKIHFPVLQVRWSDCSGRKVGTWETYVLLRNGMAPCFPHRYT